MKKKHGLMTKELKKKLRKSRNDNEILEQLAAASNELDDEDLFLVTGGAQYDSLDAKTLGGNVDVNSQALNDILNKFNFNNNSNDNGTNAYFTDGNQTDNNSTQVNLIDPNLNEYSFGGIVKGNDAPDNSNNGDAHIPIDALANKNAEISIDAGDGFDVNTLFGDVYKHKIEYAAGKFKMN